MTSSCQRDEIATASTALRSDTLQTVEAIARAVLKRPGLTVDMHFVDLGGDSLAAMTLTARLSEAFKLNLSPLLPFESEHLADMAARIQKLRTAPSGSVVERGPGEGGGCSLP